MIGTVSKRHVLLVLWHFGWRRAIKLIMSRRRVALNLLMK